MVLDDLLSIFVGLIALAAGGALLIGAAFLFAKAPTACVIFLAVCLVLSLAYSLGRAIRG